jgi:transposase
MARHVLALDEQLTANENQLDELVKVSEAAPLLEETGFRAISAAKCLAAWSQEGRVRNEAAFASLAGVNPIPASSGNTVRHRLNRGGDRSLNSALHMVAIVKMPHDGETREYVEKRLRRGPYGQGNSSLNQTLPGPPHLPRTQPGGNSDERGLTDREESTG